MKMENKTLMIKITIKGRVNGKTVHEVITELPCVMENMLEIDWYRLKSRYMIKKDDEDIVEALHDYLDLYVGAFIEYIKDFDEAPVDPNGLWYKLVKKYNLDSVINGNIVKTDYITDTIVNVGPLLFEIDCELVTLNVFSAANIGDNDNIAVSGSAVKKLITNINKELNSLFGEENEEEL